MPGKVVRIENILKFFKSIGKNLKERIHLVDTLKDKNFSKLPKYSVINIMSLYVKKIYSKSLLMLVKTVKKNLV